MPQTKEQKNQKKRARAAAALAAGTYRCACHARAYATKQALTRHLEGRVITAAQKESHNAKRQADRAAAVARGAYRCPEHPDLAFSSVTTLATHARLFHGPGNAEAREAKRELNREAYQKNRAKLDAAAAERRKRDFESGKYACVLCQRKYPRGVALERHRKTKGHLAAVAGLRGKK